MDRGAWWATVHGIKDSDTTEQLNTHVYTSIFLSRSHLSEPGFGSFCFQFLHILLLASSSFQLVQFL